MQIINKSPFFLIDVGLINDNYIFGHVQYLYEDTVLI